MTFYFCKNNLNVILSDIFLGSQFKLQISMEFSQIEYFRKMSQKLSNPNTSPKGY